MSTSWQTVSVFISSSFNDMHAERDYLVKRVFPSYGNGVRSGNYYYGKLT